MKSLKKKTIDGVTKYLTSEASKDIYTAEVNINSAGTGFTVVYGSGRGKIHVYDRTVTIEEYSNPIISKVLPKNINVKSNNAFRFSRNETGEMRLMLNNNQDFLEWKTKTKGGKIGFENLTEEKINVGFVGFSSYADGSSDRFSTKAVPGRMDAVHTLNDNTKTSYKENEKEIFCVDADNSTVFEYKVNVKEDGPYDIALQCRNPKRDLKFVLGEKELFAKKPETFDYDGSALLYIGTVNLNNGIQTIKLECKCDVTVDSFFFIRSAEVENKALITDSQPSPELTIMGLKGPRSLSRKYCGLSLSEGQGYGYIGHHGWKNYKVNAEINGTVGGTGSAEILFRIQKESYFGSQPFSSAYGYSLRISNNSLTLNEWNYGEKCLVNYSLNDVGTFKHILSLSAVDKTISVSIDGKRVFNYDIPMGNISGKVGFRITEETFGISNMNVEKV